LQRRFNGVDWRAVEDYTGAGATNAQKDMIIAAPQEIKLKMTAYTSGSVPVELRST
jgi:hypothetical protein